LRTISAILVTLFLATSYSIAATKSPQTDVWEWLDPEVEYEYTSNGNGIYGIVGAETWTADNIAGNTKSGTTPYAYICKIGTKKAIRLDVPKYHGTNKKYDAIFTPHFLRNGKWLVASATIEKDGLMFFFAWELSSKKPRILCSFSYCDEPKFKKGTLAWEYNQLVTVKAEEDILPPIPFADAQTFQIGKHIWIRW